MKSLQVKTMKYIVNNVLNVNVDSPSRKYRLIKARAICYKLLREENGMSYSEIGRYFSKTHGTIMHSLKEFDSMSLYDKGMYSDYENIKEVWSKPHKEIMESMGSLDLVVKIDMQKELRTLKDQNEELSLYLSTVQSKLDSLMEKQEL